MMGQRRNGFSLIETVVVVAVLGVLATLAVGNLNDMMKRQAFNDAVAGTVNVFLQARFYAIRTGAKAAATIENQQIIAFVDSNRNRAYDSGEFIIARYPAAQGSTLPSGLSIDCRTLRERDTGPRTAFFDGRGFYIDEHDGVARHGANLCLSDSGLGKQKTVMVTIFGNVAAGAEGCDPSPFVCPNIAPE